MVLASVERDTPIEKLAEVADIIANVSSTHMISIAGILNSESEHLVKILEAQKKLETKTDELSKGIG